MAIKIVRAEYVNNPDFIRRFEIEARTVARLEHLHIVPLYDYWRDPNGAYLVMRWLRGGSLRNLLRREGKLPLNLVVKIIQQIGSALVLAHRQGVVHRDIKPENILMDEAKNAYLTDFGIAVDLAGDSDLMRDLMSFGSPAYISPEQITGRMITPLADIYSLGILIYELLTGEIPFQSNTTTTTLIKSHINDPVPSIQSKRPDLPALLDSVIWQATAKTPSARYSSVLELLQAFLEVVGDQVDGVTAELQDYLTADLSVASSGTRPLIDNTKPFDPVIGGTKPLNDIPGHTNPKTLTMSYIPTNPYKGLLPFDESDAVFFHGRGQLIHDLLVTFREEKRYFFALIGPSGGGKSSLVKAGILPKLRRGAVQNSEQWFYINMTPGTQPFQKLAQALLQVLIDPVDDLEHYLRSTPDALNQLMQTKRPLTDSDLFIFIDQFEELFTLVEDEAERVAFLNLFNHIETGVRVILTLRADYYDRPLLYAEFGDLLRKNTTVVLPLAPDELRQAITRPAEQVGLQVEPTLVDAIIKDVAAQPGALPLVQYAMTELFEQRQDNTLKLATYEAIGGISGALAQRASELYEKLNPEQQKQARQLFLRLITVDDAGRAFRRRALWDEIRPMAELVDLFTRYRLLITDRDPLTRMPTVEVAHEAILTEWAQLKSWIDDNQLIIKRHQALSAAARDWENAQRDASYLARGARLVEFESLFEEPLSPLETAYIQRSIALRKQLQRRGRAVIGVLLLLTLISSVMAVLAVDRQAQANRAAAISRSRELAAVTRSRLNDNDLALLLAVEAVRAADTYEARDSLLTALQANAFIQQYLYSGEARAVAFDGETLVTGGASLIRWDNGQPIYLEGHTQRVNSVALHHGIIASAGDDGTIRLWGGAAHVMDVGVEVRRVMFSPDGSRLVSADEAGHVILWDVATGEAIRNLNAHDDIAFTAIFNPDGDAIASAGADNLVKLWDAETGELLTTPLDAHTNWVLALAFSPNGRVLASAGADLRIIFWDMETFETLAIIESGHTGWINSLAFSPDGQLLLSGSADGTIRVWDLTTMQSRVLDGNVGSVWDIAFDPRSLRFVSVGDQTLLWDITLPPRPGEAIIFAEQAIEQVLVVGDQLFIGEADGSIHIWQDGTHVKTLRGHTAPITSMDIQHDRLISGSADGQVLIWDGDSNRELLQLTDPVWVVHWEEDSVLIAGDHPSILRLNPETGETIAEFSGVAGVLSLVTDGQYIIAGERNGMIHVWDDKGLRYSISAHESAVTSLLLDGDMLISAGRDRTIKLWDIQTGELLQPPLVGHTDWVLDIALGYQMLASAGRDGTVRLWSLPEGRPLGNALTGHFDWVTTVAFGDGVLYSAGHDQTVIAWDIALDDWLSLACRISNRNLTMQEWRQYFPDEVYRQTCPVTE